MLGAFLQSVKRTKRPLKQQLWIADCQLQIAENHDGHCQICNLKSAIRSPRSRLSGPSRQRKIRQIAMFGAIELPDRRSSLCHLGFTLRRMPFCEAHEEVRAWRFPTSIDNSCSVAWRGSRTPGRISSIDFWAWSST
jgi:hypothetical protein